MVQWIGLREHLFITEKPSIFPWRSWGFPVNFPSNQWRGPISVVFLTPTYWAVEHGESQSKHGHDEFTNRTVISLRKTGSWWGFDWNEELITHRVRNQHVQQFNSSTVQCWAFSPCRLRWSYLEPSHRFEICSGGIPSAKHVVQVADRG